MNNNKIYPWMFSSMMKISCGDGEVLDAGSAELKAPPPYAMRFPCHYLNRALIKGYFVAKHKMPPKMPLMTSSGFSRSTQPATFMIFSSVLGRWRFSTTAGSPEFLLFVVWTSFFSTSGASSRSIITSTMFMPFPA